MKKLCWTVVPMLYIALIGEIYAKYPSNHGGGTRFYWWLLFVACVLNACQMIKEKKIFWPMWGTLVLYGLFLIACNIFNVLVSYETWIDRGMPAWGTVFSMDAQSSIFPSREKDSRELSLKGELRPATMNELVSLSAEELERVDLGRMNLICADAAFGTGQSDMPRLLRTLDEWAEVAKAAEKRYKPSFDRNPARYDNSYAKFRVVNLILTIKEDLKCRYQISLVESGELYMVKSPAFFKNPDDAFISGLLRSRRGTCSSYAPLIVALGRRLGYPLCLKATNGHLLCCWDDVKESFNVDTNGNGVDTPADEYYFKDRNHRLSGLSRTELERERLMCPLKAVDCMSFFLETVGYCHEANGRLSKAQYYYNLALKYRPGAVNLTRLASRQVI